MNRARSILPNLLALTATAAVFGATCLLLAHEAPATASAGKFQQINQPDLVLVISEQDQLQHAQRAVYHELVRPLRPQIAVSKFSRSEPTYDPDFRPVFSQAQNGTVPFALYKHTGTRKRANEQTKTLHLVGYYDVTAGRTMVFDSQGRQFVATKELGKRLRLIGSHQQAKDAVYPRTELAKHAPASREITH